jgi:hypothetical protein
MAMTEFYRSRRAPDSNVSRDGAICAEAREVM